MRHGPTDFARLIVPRQRRMQRLFVRPEAATIRQNMQVVRSTRTPPAALTAGQYPLHKLLHCRNKPIRVEWISRKPKRVVAAEHQVLLYCRRFVALMRNILQRFLNAEAARVGTLAGGMIRFRLCPVGEAALTEAAHARGLIRQDLSRLL